MSLDSDTAAAVAARHGLGLPDAQALTVLADGEAHAELLATKFARRDQGDGSGTADRHGGVEAGRQRARDRYGEPS
jgi:hypothetical protein